MLNESQEKFFKATLRGEKPEQAAISAGLSPKTAKAAGHRMRKHPAIVAALAAVGIGTKAAPTAKEKPVESSEEPGIVTVEIPETDDPKAFLIALMNSPQAGVKARLEAAKALLPFEHSKMGEKGKKVTKEEGAKELAGRGHAYGSRKPPKLVVDNG